MLRLFVCVWIPDTLREKIVKFQEEIMKLPLKGKFVEPQNLHVTVTFLGNKKNEEVTPLKKNLDKAVSDIDKFHVKLEGLKLIPNEDFIRVIGIGLKDSERFSNLIKSVTNLIDGKYYTEEKLTLCRVKKIFEKEKIKDFIKEKRKIKIGSFEVKNVALVKSTLTSRGPIYKTIHVSFLK